MAKPLLFKTSYIFGINEPKPLRGFPPGEVSLIQRSNDYVRARVEHKGRARHFVVKVTGDHWEPGIETPAPLTAHF